MTTAPLVTDLVVLVRASLADLRDAGILSDFLDERGDPRGVLLRRRWRRWRTERNYKAMDGSPALFRSAGWGILAVYRSWDELADSNFAAYIRRRFLDAA